MTTLSAQPPVRAHPIARLWTWMVSIALCLSAFPVGFGGVWAVRNWRDVVAYAEQTHRPPPLNLPMLQAYPTMWAGLLCWLAAWGLHIHASRRRRMHLVHVVAPASIFVLSLIAAFCVPPGGASH